jgi:sulfur relay (sulfurtransferase) complex TusBCD TusD component (DsrE family)
MDLRGKKLGLLVSCRPEDANFSRALALAETALARGVSVYLYCLDDAVAGLEDDRMRTLKRSGARLFACALAAQRRRIPFDDRATFAGLTMVSEMIGATDRFLSFN